MTQSPRGSGEDRERQSAARRGSCLEGGGGGRGRQEGGGPRSGGSGAGREGGRGIAPERGAGGDSRSRDERAAAGLCPTPFPVNALRRWVLRETALVQGGKAGIEVTGLDSTPVLSTGH